MMNKHNERAELPQRGTADEQAKDLWELYLKAAKISGSSLLANEPCPESDKAALYRIACDVLNGIGCVYYDITGEWPNLNAPHKAAALLEAQPAEQAKGREADCQPPVWSHGAEAMYWLNEIEKYQGGTNGPTIKLRAALELWATGGAIAYRYKKRDSGNVVWMSGGKPTDPDAFDIEPLYTTPPAPPARGWVELTDEDREVIRLNVGQEYCPYTAEATESKLREKNAGL